MLMTMVKCKRFISVFLPLVVAIIIPSARGGLFEGYNYQPPQPPIQFDEPINTSPPPPLYIPPSSPFQDDFPQVIPTYLPPSVLYPPLGSPPLQDDIQPPYEDTVVIPSPTSPPPTNQYLPPLNNPPLNNPPLNNPPSNQYLPPANPLGRQFPSSSSPQVRIVNMSCLDTRDGNGFFRTTFRPSTRTLPVIDSVPSDCVVSPISDSFRIDLDGPRMITCGVRSCGNRMCLTLRMATVGGLRLADDPLVTLQCIPQEAVVSNTKHFRINANADQGRAFSRSVAVAGGGNQRRFDTQINLLRRSSGSDIFDQPVQPGSAVRLGDELMLRAAVKEGDGWRYSRMGSVIVRSAASQRSVTLVDDDGCRSPSMRSVSPQQPHQLSPLITQLPFRAFLFQGAAPADDLLLSVRMLGCIRPRDCLQSRSCEDGRRVRRSLNDSSETSTTDWELGEFQFRVLPRDSNSVEEKSDNNNINFLALTCLLTVAAGLACLAFVLIKSLKQHQLS